MTANPLTKAAILMVAIVVTALTAWELFLRNKGITPSYDDGPALWSNNRRMVYEPADKATVFIGSSRIKYDLDIDTWKNITGDHPIQLAVEGQSPLPALYDLADDKNFQGRLVIDVTEILFFSNSPGAINEVSKNIKHYSSLTPAERASFKLNKLVESQFVFLDKDNFSLSAQLDKLEIPSRPGVFMMPIFPLDFGRTTFERQAKMTDKFVADTNLQNKVKAVWDFLRKSNKAPPLNGTALDSVFQTIKTAVDKIKARGGQVLFVRTPSSGGFWQGEQRGFPREQYWDRLLQVTNCTGIHFKDYPTTANFICPELSHLTPADAVLFTKEFIKILMEKGWKFPKSSGL
ncbi:MAG TPA: hypothetical protein VMZ03_05315 [Chitinophagaceae bacterium]|nr:hypothetical protein [Chitinophagaceae bacterium]